MPFKNQTCIHSIRQDSRSIMRVQDNPQPSQWYFSEWVPTLHYFLIGNSPSSLFLQPLLTTTISSVESVVFLWVSSYPTFISHCVFPSESFSSTFLLIRMISSAELVVFHWVRFYPAWFLIWRSLVRLFLQPFIDRNYIFRWTFLFKPLLTRMVLFNGSCFFNLFMMISPKKVLPIYFSISPPSCFINILSMILLSNKFTVTLLVMEIFEVWSNHRPFDNGNLFHCDVNIILLVMVICKIMILPPSFWWWRILLWSNHYPFGNDDLWNITYYHTFGDGVLWNHDITIILLVRYIIEMMN